MKPIRIIPAVVAVLVASLLAAPSAGADPAKAGSASAYGARIDITDQNVITEPVAESTLAEEDVTATTIDVPADPLAVSGTLTASAAVHQASDLASELLVNAQPTPGPYNARGFGEIEGAQVLLDTVGEGVPLLRADAVRAEAVAVCVGDQVTYSAQSEIVNLDIGGEDVPLNAPLEQIIDALNDVLEQSGLNQVVNVERNVVTQSATGAAVDALRVTVLAAAGDVPLGTVVLGHAEVANVGCGAATQCSDTEDNDGDGRIDAEDPGCHTDGDASNPDSYDPADDDESDPECSDTVDNDGVQGADSEDPDCHTDGNASNPDSYDPLDDSEAGPQPAVADDSGGLPRTGGDPLLAGAMVAGLLGLAALEVARRRQSV
jgi:hypothetical protein